MRKRAPVPRTEPTTEAAPAAPRSRKGAATRARLLDAAKTVFEKDGFLEARITDIAEQAGISHGTFYHYYESKEQIFREVAAAQEELLTAPAETDDGAASGGAGAAVATAKKPVSEFDRILRANRNYLERYRDEAALMGVIEQVSRYDEHVNAARMATMKHFVERAEASIRRLQKDKAVDSRIDPALAADALGAMVARFAELWLVQGYRDYDFDDAVEQLTILWANAIGLQDQPKRRRHKS